MRRVKRVEKRGLGEFRLLRHIGHGRGLSREEALDYAADVNVARLKKHMAKVARLLHSDLPLRRIKIKTRRRQLANMQVGAST